ncbi:hypothetical protein [Pseudogemmobacter sp. W21_MBD1_M6]
MFGKPLVSARAAKALAIALVVESLGVARRGLPWHRWHRCPSQ